jgi:AraC-like DNA-binding protein
MTVPAILRSLTLGAAEWETRGVLRPRAQPAGSPQRFPPAADLSAFVDLYWIASWDLGPGETLVVETLPHPCVNVVVEQGRSLVYGPVRGRFSRTLAGRGRVVSARLRPGAFRVWNRQPAWRLVDAAVDFPAAFGVESGPLESAVLGQAGDRGMVSALEQFLRERLPALPAPPAPPDGAARDQIDRIDLTDRSERLDLIDRIDLIERIDRIIGRIASDRDVVRVEDLALAMGLGRRTLERLFREHVGLSPKWVIRQYRMQVAADEAAKGRAVDWPRLANDLGYADQAHFIRDFRAILGTTPSEFARQALPPRPV